MTTFKTTSAGKSQTGSCLLLDYATLAVSHKSNFSTKRHSNRDMEVVASSLLTGVKRSKHKKVQMNAYLF